jgi:transcriptional regulator with XRE-family HTH domain
VLSLQVSPPQGLRANASPFGAQLRQWRARRRLSQMDLALDVGVSPRHLSFVETGRSRPSPEVLLALADRLDVPLRERNEWLLAAGYAPRFSHQALDPATMPHIVATLQRVLDAHDPYPGLVLDRQWNVVQANGAAQRLVALLPAHLRAQRLNIFRASLHPEGFAAHTANFDEWAGYLLEALRRAVSSSGDAELAALQQEVLAWPQVTKVAAAMRSQTPAAAPTLLVPCVMTLPFGSLSMFSTLTTFGTPRDVTLDELCIELFYPMDAASEALLRRLASAPAALPAR